MSFLTYRTPEGSKRWPLRRARGWGSPRGERTAVEGGTGRFVATRVSSEIAKTKNAIFQSVS